MTRDERFLQSVAENVAESALIEADELFGNNNSSTCCSTPVHCWEDDEDLSLSSLKRRTLPELYSKDSSKSEQRNAKRPEWQRLCVQYGVCIHYIYGNCVYEEQCFYKHVEAFTKNQLLYKTELCRYGPSCANQQNCPFAHFPEERRTPEQNTFEYFSQNPVPKMSQPILSPCLSSSQSSFGSPSISPSSSRVPSPIQNFQPIHYGQNPIQQQQQQQQQMYHQQSRVISPNQMINHQPNNRVNQMNQPNRINQFNHQQQQHQHQHQQQQMYQMNYQQQQQQSQINQMMGQAASHTNQNYSRQMNQMDLSNFNNKNMNMNYPACAQSLKYPDHSTTDYNSHFFGNMMA